MVSRLRRFIDLDDDLIKEMIKVKGPVICDVIVDPSENCFPMIPSGSTHNQMLLGPNDKVEGEISEDGMKLLFVSRHKIQEIMITFLYTTYLHLMIFRLAQLKQNTMQIPNQGKQV